MSKIKSRIVRRDLLLEELRLKSLFHISWHGLYKELPEEEAIQEYRKHFRGIRKFAHRLQKNRRGDQSRHYDRRSLKNIREEIKWFDDWLCLRKDQRQSKER